MAADAKAFDERVTVDAFDGRLPGGVDRRDDDRVGVVEAGAEPVEEIAEPGVAVRLDDGDDMEQYIVPPGRLLFSVLLHVVAVVQPHRYTRLRDLFDGFCSCFNDADTVIVAPVYAAGEAPIEGVDRDALVEGLRIRGHRDARALPSREALAGMIKDTVRPGDTVVCLRRRVDHPVGLCAASGTGQGVVAELETPHDQVTNSRRTGPQAAQYPEIPWRRVIDFGNQFRHAYHHINPGILWSVYANDLDSLEATLLRMIAAYRPIPERPEDVRG